MKQFIGTFPHAWSSYFWSVCVGWTLCKYQFEYNGHTFFLQKATTLFSVLRRWWTRKKVREMEIILNTCGSTITIFLLCYLFTNLENVELGYDEGGVYELRLLRGCSWAEVDKSFLLLLLLLHLKHAFNNYSNQIFRYRKGYLT